MENDKKWKVYTKKYSLPVVVFLLIFFIVLSVLNFLFNTLMTAYNSYVKEGTLLNPKPINFTSEWFLDYTVLFIDKGILIIAILISLSQVLI